MKLWKKIEFYVIKGKMGSKKIFPLLVSIFPDTIIHKRDFIMSFKNLKHLRSPLRTLNTNDYIPSIMVLKVLRFMT